MFAIQDLHGPTFQGPLEQLYKVQPVLKSHQAMLDTADQPDFDSREGRRKFEKAEQAYRQALNLENKRTEIFHVHQIMRRNPKFVPPDMLIGTAWSALQDHRVKQLPVVGEEDRVVGLLTESNLLRRMIVSGSGDMLQVPRDPVQDVMTRPVITADPMTDIRRIARVMADYKFPAIPITESDHSLAGIVTRGDILRKFANTPPLQLWS